MRLSSLLHLPTALLVVLAPGCSSDDVEAADGSETGATDTGTSTSPSPTAPTAEPSSGDPTDDTIDDDTTDTGPEPEPEPDPYDGVWCGTASTGQLSLGYLSGAVVFSRSHGGPLAFAGGATTDGSIQVTTYDVAAASWGELVTLQEGFFASTLGEMPLGATDAEGNAIVAYAVADPEMHVVAQHYDAAAGTWTRVDLPGTVTSAAMKGLSMSASGHAVLLAGQGSPTAWFLDAATGQWSAATSYVAADDDLVWAQDPETGDVALLFSPASGVMALQHRDAATGALTEAEADVSGYAARAVAIGNGEFLLVSDDSGSQIPGDLHAHHFDGTDWQATEVLGSGYALGGVRLASTGDGRAVASWNDLKQGVYARTFDGDAGWGELLTANPTSASSLEGWADNRVAIDDAGFTVVASSYGIIAGLRTVARRHEAGGWDEWVDLDPEQPFYDTRISSLESLGVDRLRAVWGRDGGAGINQYLYACHTPVSGWSGAMSLPDGTVWNLGHRPGGDLLLVFEDATGKSYAEYFASL